MAENVSYPQIPSTVWSGVWQILHDSPSRKIDENILAIELSVQKTAAKQYLNELMKLGLFEADNSPSALAKDWRQDADNPEVITRILAKGYPEELRELAPPDKLDREKIVRWFVAQGLGAGAAQNKAATYIRIASGSGPTDAPKQSKVSDLPRTPRKAAATSRTNDQRGRLDDKTNDKPTRQQTRPDLNVNVQIHISADSTKEQIDAIFSAMRRYFDGDQLS